MSPSDLLSAPLSKTHDFARGMMRSVVGDDNDGLACVALQFFEKFCELFDIHLSFNHRKVQVSGWADHKNELDAEAISVVFHDRSGADLAPRGSTKVIAAHITP